MSFSRAIRLVNSLCTNSINASSTVPHTYNKALSGHVSFAFRKFQNDARRKQGSKAEVGMYLTAVAIGMLGLSFASVPLYRMFCAATGYGGVAQTGKTVEEKLKARLENPNEKTEAAAASRTLRIWFASTVADGMPWKFVPNQEMVTVKPGESTLVFFKATNNSDKPITGVSIYNVTPEKSAYYFNKIQCFCFEQQRLQARETVDMPVFFYVDPEFATDWNCRTIHDITLSYTFYPVEDDDEDEVEIPTGPTVVKLHGNPPPANLAALQGLSQQPNAQAPGSQGTALQTPKDSPPAASAANPAPQ